MATESDQSGGDDAEFRAMLHWQTKCSICFDRNLDLSLQRCRDQFCFHCFGRYVGELVRGAWGMANRCTIQCPVCLDPIHKQEWSQWVRRDIVELFDRNNRPFKTLWRCCPLCEHEIHVTRHINGADSAPEAVLEEIVAGLLNLHGPADWIDEFRSLGRRRVGVTDTAVSTVAHLYRAVLPKWIEMYSEPLAPPSPPAIRGPSVPLPAAQLAKRRRLRSESRAVATREFNADVMDGSQSYPSIENITSTAQFSVIYDADRSRTIWRLSSLLIGLEQRQEAFRDLQFQHMAHFPRAQCPQCSTLFCYQCGHVGWHEGWNCLDWMRLLLERWNPNDTSTSPDPLNHPPPPFNDSRLQQPKSIVGLSCRSQSSPTTSNDTSASTFVEGALPYCSAEWWANLKWKLENSVPCPRCHTLINREEGCNKIDCTVCGHRFCWSCLGDWSEKCGFYKCRLDGTDPNLKSTAIDPKRFELGVPDIFQIQNRLSRQSFPVRPATM